MNITKEKKKEVVKNLKEKIDQQKAIVFVNTKDLKTKDIEGLKKDLKKQNCSFLVAKKTLLNIALKEVSINPIDIETQFGLVFGFEDEIAPAKIVQQKSRSSSIKILGGILENEIVSDEQMVALAKLPSKEILLQRLVGSISSPITGFLNVLQGNIKGLVYVLNSIKNNHREKNQ